MPDSCNGGGGSGQTRPNPVCFNRIIFTLKSGESAVNRRLMAFGGGALLLLGAFLPVLSVPVVGSMSYFNNGKGDGTVIVLLALGTFVLAARDRFRTVLYIGSAAGAVILAGLGYMVFSLQRLQESITADSSGFASAIGGALVNSIQVQWGWAVLILGAFLVICAGVSGVGRQPDPGGGPDLPRADARREYIRAGTIAAAAVLLAILGHSLMNRSFSGGRANVASIGFANHASSGTTDTAASVPSVRLPAWDVSVDTNAMDGTMKTILALDASDASVSEYGIERRARLILRCSAGRLEAFVSTPSQLQSDYETHSVAVRLRFDGGSPEATAWSESEGGDAMFAPQPRALVSRLLKTQQLLVEYPPFQRTPTTVRFVTTGLTAQLQYMSGCHIS
jgi:hypothetical protein